MTNGAPLVRRLLDVVDLIATNLEPTALLEHLTSSARELFGAQGAGWCACEGDRMRIVTAAGLSPDLLGLTFPVAGSGVGALIDTGRRSLVSTVARYPHLNDRIYGGPDEQMAIALARVGDQVLGALYVTLLPEHGFGVDELEVLELLASHAGMALHHVALYRDAERAREESTAVIAAMADGVSVVESDGTVRSWNGSMARLTGWPAERAVGRAVPFALPEVGEVLTSRPVSGRWLDVVVSPAGAGGERVVSARDVTAAKELEAAQELFLATASHELRTPLTVLRGFGETLLRHWDVLDDVDRRELAERMLVRSEGMSALVEQVLSATAAGLTTAAATPEPFDLAAVTGLAARSLAGASAAHPLVVRTQGPVPAVGRPETVAALLDQLVENAVKYSPDGGPVEVEVLLEPDAAVLTVVDRGPGIRPADVERVFDRFQRGRQALGGPSGAGLGLWIVRRTVQAQGGSVSAAPREGGGTVLTVRLPRGEPTGNQVVV
ncbi:ATP-binding protein [soil metagenome]